MFIRKPTLNEIHAKSKAKCNTELMNLSFIKLGVNERLEVAERSFVPAIDKAGHAVELAITLVASEILPSILDGGQSQNDTNGNDGHLRLESVHGWDKV